MNKLHKIINILLSYFIFLFIFSIVPIQAEEIISYPESWITIKLISCSIQTTYNPADYSVRYKTEGNKYTAIILDEKGNEVSRYSETIKDMDIQDVILFNKVNTISYESIVEGMINLVGGRSDFQAYLKARMKISSGNYWRQCDELLEYEYSSGNSDLYSLEGTQSFEATTSYPNGKVKIDINGVIETNAISLTNLETLKTLGFTINDSPSSSWYSRKTYNTSVTFIFMN